MGRKKYVLLGAVMLVIGAVMVLDAWHYRFLCDDAYIMFRYARNLSRGDGLVFNPGEHVEGYTSLLWTLQLGIGEWLDISSEIFAYVLGVFYTVLTLLVWGAFIYRQGPRHNRWGAVAITFGFLAINRTWATWTTSGLETRSFTFYTLLFFYALLCSDRASGETSRRRWLAAASAVLALAVFSRPDAQVFFPAAFAYVAIRALPERRLSSLAGRLLAVTAPFVLLVGAHYAWRLSYYGYWFPNTYYVKVEGDWPQLGWRYAAAFLLEYALYLVFPLIALMWRRIAPESRRLMAVIGAAILLHASYYCILVGGDHFEFRIFDFYMPAIGWALAESLVALWATRPALAAAAAAAVAVYGCVIPVSTALHPIHRVAMPFKITVDNTPVARWLPGMPLVIRADGALMAELNAHFACARQEVHRLFWLNQRHRFILAKGAVEKRLIPRSLMVNTNPGVIGYYVDLPLIDMLGLTDAFVGHQGQRTEHNLMAHDTMAPLSYLLQRHARLWIVSATPEPQPQLPTPFVLRHLPKPCTAYSIRLGDRAWLNIATWDDDWVRDTFRVSGRELIPYPRALAWKNAEGSRS